MSFIQKKCDDNFKIVTYMRAYFLSKIEEKQKIEEDDIQYEPSQCSYYSSLKPDLESMIFNQSGFVLQENNEYGYQYSSLHLFQEVQSTRSQIGWQQSDGSSLQSISQSEFL